MNIINLIQQNLKIAHIARLTESKIDRLAYRDIMVMLKDVSINNQSGIMECIEKRDPTALGQLIMFEIYKASESEVIDKMGAGR